MAAAGWEQAWLTPPCPPGRAAEGSSWRDEGSVTQNTNEEPCPLAWDGQQGLSVLLPRPRTGVGVQEGQACKRGARAAVPQSRLSGSLSPAHAAGGDADGEFQGAFLPRHGGGKDKYNKREK